MLEHEVIFLVRVFLEKCRKAVNISKNLSIATQFLILMKLKSCLIRLALTFNLLSYTVPIQT